MLERTAQVEGVACVGSPVSARTRLLHLSQEDNVNSVLVLGTKEGLGGQLRDQNFPRGSTSVVIQGAGLLSSGTWVTSSLDSTRGLPPPAFATGTVVLENSSGPGFCVSSSLQVNES